MKNKVTIPLLRQKKERGEKIVMITCYDYPSALLLDAAGADILFIGDSLGDNVLGYDTTIPVTVEEMIHHSKAVRRGTQRAMALADMPFLSYQVTPEEALTNAGRMMKESGVEAVKVEGGEAVVPAVRKLVSAGVPVMGHIGLTPQSVHQFGGYRVQGRSEAEADRLLAEGQALAEAGVFAVVLELVQPDVAKRITKELPIPTIGIASGPHCDGQVQVFHDLFGLYPDRVFRHNKRYTEAGRAIKEAAEKFAEEVRSGAFPAPDQTLS